MSALNKLTFVEFRKTCSRLLSMYNFTVKVDFPSQTTNTTFITKKAQKHSTEMSEADPPFLILTIFYKGTIKSIWQLQSG